MGKPLIQQARGTKVMLLYNMCTIHSDNTGLSPAGPGGARTARTYYITKTNCATFRGAQKTDSKLQKFIKALYL